MLQDPTLIAAKTIHPGQVWARPTTSFELTGVDVQVAIEDLSGRFNLMPLLRSGKADEISLQRWARLLEALQLAPLDLPPLRGTKVSDISQLRLLQNVSADSLERLKLWIVLLPSDALLNVNTASATQLATLEGMSAATVQAHILQRPLEGFNDAQAFTRSPGLERLGIASQALGMSSRWFRVTVEVGVGTSRLRLISDMEHRPQLNMRVVQRRFLAPNESESS